MHGVKRYKDMGKASTLIPRIVLLAPFVQYWFFAACIVLGIDYDETSSGGLYGIATAGLCATCILYFLKLVVSDKECYRKACWLCLCGVGLIGASLAANLTTYHQYTYLPNFIIFGLMGLCAGMSLSQREKVLKATKVLDVVSLVCFIGAALFELAQYSDSVWRARGYAGLSYQTVSYMVAIAYSFNLWSLAFARPENRFSMFNQPIFRAVRVALVPVLVTVSVLSGGRGGVLAIVAVSLVAIVVQMRSGRMPIKVGLTIVLVGTIMMVALFVWGDELLSFRGFERIITRGDNRSDVWGMALVAIEGSPVLGYGFGGYGRAFDGLYPHNIILDVVLCSGFVGLVAFFCIAAYVVKRIARIVDIDRAWGSLLAIVGTFALTFLSVSGTFLSCAPFWFVVAAAISYNGADAAKRTNNRWSIV